jgi:hypothetical protein
MNLKEQILQEHSKENTLKIAKWIGNDKARLQTLMQLFLYDEYRVVQRGSWIVGTIGETKPEMIEPYLGKVLARCTEDGIHVAVKRNVTRILQFTNIPEEHHGTVMNLCFNFLMDPKETVAVRCFSMSILANLSTKYPEIKNELRSVIEDILEHQETSAGFKARSRKTLQQIKASR